jgi:hypothetical protein
MRVTRRIMIKMGMAIMKTMRKTLTMMSTMAITLQASIFHSNLSASLTTNNRRALPKYSKFPSPNRLPRKRASNLLMRTRTGRQRKKYKISSQTSSWNKLEVTSELSYDHYISDDSYGALKIKS